MFVALCVLLLWCVDVKCSVKRNDWQMNKFRIRQNFLQSGRTAQMLTFLPMLD